MNRWSRWFIGLTLILIFSMGVVVGTAFGQTSEIGLALRGAEELKESSLAKGALWIAGVCVGAMTYMARLMVQWNNDAVKLAIEQTTANVKAADAMMGLKDEVRELVLELKGRPCLRP